MGNDKKQSIIIFTALFFIEIVLLSTGFGVISNGSLSVTVLQIPVILGSALLGLPAGLVLGATFGIGTMVIAAGYGIETLDHLFISPIISVIPRLLIAVVSWLTYKSLKKLIDDYTIFSECVAGAGAAFSGTITNTVLVTLFLSLLYPEMLGESSKMSGHLRAFMNIIGANTSLEICISVLVAIITIYILKRKKMQYQEISQRPMRKYFQKWLILVMTGGFLVTMFCSYTLQTIQEKKQAESYLRTVLLRLEQELKEKKEYASMDLKMHTRGIIVFAENGQVTDAGNEKLIGKSLEEIGISSEELEKEMFTVVLSGSTYFCKVLQLQDITVIGMLLADEIFAGRNETAIILLLVNIIIFVVIFLLVSKLLQKNVVDHIYHVNQSLSMIQSGDLEELVEVRNNEEFSVLSDGINATVHALKKTMEEVAAKINQEMEFAREIQHAALPITENVLPQFHEYEIDGMMDAAKEVGGDFFDYFLIGERKLGVVIADVSGKGVPSALFMMTAKTLIKNFVLNGKSPAEALELANMQLCENNEAGMFVTVWLGVLNYGTGILTFANAGHNPPLLKKEGQPFVYMDHKIYKRNIMLGMREGVRYRDNQIPFNKGDILYLYTDGVTEANNERQELYGEERLLHCVEHCYEQSPKQFIQTIRHDIDSFAGKAEQFDDITMVVLKMCVEWKKLILDAVYENTEKGAKFIEDNFPKNCSMKVFRQLAVAFDEIYSNVVKYSRATQIEIKMAILEDMIYLTFIDNGIPYNPLESAEPDLDTIMEEGKIGGFGLFVVKRTMDYVDYQYKNRKNVFSIGKKLL